ncbi:MAG TPA: hypothetical protein VJG13_11345 [Thermoanaerobaculia bacterium]|nr:hypothetical protein [Thermoanaerobaculia bacterium]
MRRAAAAFVLIALLAPVAAPPARGQFVVIDPANLYEQILQYGQMLADYYQQWQILTTQYRQIEGMLQNLEDLERAASDNPVRFLIGLRDVFWRLQGVVYAADDVLGRYDEAYTPEVSYELSRSEADRLRATLTTYRTLMAAAREHARSSEDSAGALSSLMGQLQAAEGNLQALQAVGALTTQVATETTRASEVQALAVNALIVREAHELSREEEARLTLLDWMHRGSLYRGPSPGRSFDPVPPAFGGGSR